MTTSRRQRQREAVDGMTDALMVWVLGMGMFAGCQVLNAWYPLQ